MERVQPETHLPKTPPDVISYIANLTQVTTGAPIAVVLYNNGNLTVTWTRIDAGYYVGTITDYTGMDEFYLPDCGTATIQQVAAGNQLSIATTTNTITISQWNGTALVDGIFQAAFELKIYKNLAKFY